jgi:hypothetical protein
MYNCTAWNWKIKGFRTTEVMLECFELSQQRISLFRQNVMTTSAIFCRANIQPFEFGLQPDQKCSIYGGCTNLATLKNVLVSVFQYLMYYVPLISPILISFTGVRDSRRYDARSCNLSLSAMTDQSIKDRDEGIISLERTMVPPPASHKVKQSPYQRSEVPLIMNALLTACMGLCFCLSVS